MIQPYTIFRYLWVSAWYAFAVSVVLLAIIFGIARLLLPYASEYKSEVSTTLSEYLDQQVMISSLDAEWHGFGPSLVLEGVDLLDPKSGKPALQFGKARLGIGLITSLLQLKPVLSGITLVGIDLVLTREKNGRFVVEGVGAENKSKSKVDGKNVSQASSLDALTSWVFSQDELALEDSNITWLDKMGAGRKMHFSAVNVRLKNSGDDHILDASVILPKKFGKSLSVHVDMEGDLLNAEERKTRAYFRGEDVKLASLLETQSIAGVGANVGEANFQIWSQWENGVLQKIQGESDVSNVELFSSDSAKMQTNNNEPNVVALRLRKLAGKFKWFRKDHGWQFNGDDLVLLRDDYLWIPSQIAVSVKNRQEGIESIEAYASHLQLEDAAQLMALFSVGGDKVKTPLLAIKPKGKVKDARLVWKNDEHPTYKAYAGLHQASINGWKSVPAANNVTGQLWLDENGGQVDLKESAMILDFPNLFRWPLRVDELSGDIGWKIDGESWQLKGRDLVAKNKDVSSRVALDIVKENANISPFISLVAKFTDGVGSQVTHYLPTGIMSNPAVDWLDNAIVEGHVASGGTVIHGRLSDFPFVSGNGRFEVRFGVENGRLDYAHDWPSIYDIDAEVQFLGKGLSVNARNGKIFSNDIQWATVNLPDLKAKPLQAFIKGSIKGNTQNKLDYLVASPQLNKSFGKYLEGMTSEGDSLLHLDLNLPIGDYENTTLQGWVDLEENSLSIPALGRVLGDVKGRLQFFQSGLEADDLRAELFGQSTSLKIYTDKNIVENIATGASKGTDVAANIASNGWINIQADGLLNAKDMASFYLPSIKDLLEGDGEWDMLFKIPVGGSKEKPRVATLQASTDLKGVEVKLPPPFNKKSDDSAKMKLHVDFRPGQAPLLRVGYAEFIDALFELGEQAGENNIAGIQRGEVRLSGGEVSLPDGNGVRIVGWLDEVALDDWLGLLSVSDSKPVDQKMKPSMLHSADIAIRKLEAYGQKLHEVRLKTVPVESSWAFDVKSNEFSGQFEIPSNIMSRPVKANLEYLYLAEPELTAGSVDPRDIPALDIQVKDLRYESRRFGEIKLETTRVANGLRIEQLVLKPKATTIISNGGWYSGGDKENSEIQVHVETTDVGRTLKELGYVGTISGGKGDIRLELQWPSALFDVDVNQIQGNMNMLLSDGQLLDVDPGAGRLFGMLSLQTLPQRLFLDFSDVFAKGFGFSRIKGNFTIEDGNAYTNNLYLDGPAARVNIAGRTGLADQDYDQKVIVIPKVTESLPLLGALAATPQVGAVILFMQKLFQTDIDKAAKNEYTITGSWSNPIIKKIESAKLSVQPTVDPSEEN